MFFLILSTILSVVPIPQGNNDDAECLTCELSRSQYFNPIDLEGEPMWVRPCLPINYSIIRVIQKQGNKTLTRERLTFKAMKIISKIGLKNVNKFKRKWVRTF